MVGPPFRHETVLQNFSEQVSHRTPMNNGWSRKYLDSHVHTAKLVIPLVGKYIFWYRKIFF